MNADDFDFSEAVEEFKYQIRRFGWYDSIEDPGWRHDDHDTFSLVAELTWVPAGRLTVPSRLWDAGLPSVSGIRVPAHA